MGYTNKISQKGHTGSYCVFCQSKKSSQYKHRMLLVNILLWFLVTTWKNGVKFITVHIISCIRHYILMSIDLFILFESKIRKNL